MGVFYPHAWDGRGPLGNTHTSRTPPLILMVVLCPKKKKSPFPIEQSYLHVVSLHVHGQLDSCGAGLQARGATSSERLEIWVASAKRKPSSAIYVLLRESRDGAKCRICVSLVVRHVVALGGGRCCRNWCRLSPVVREPCGFTGANDVRRGPLDASDVPKHVVMETCQDAV